MMVDDDFVLVDEKTPEPISVTSVTEKTKAPRKKRPSEVAKAAAKATKPKIAAVTAAQEAARKPESGFRDTKARMDSAKTIALGKQATKAKSASETRIEKLIAKGAKKPTAKTVKALKTAALKVARKLDGKPKATKTTKAKVAKTKLPKVAVTKPKNIETLTRARSRQRQGRVAGGMMRTGDMAQVTLTFPSKQLDRMRAFATRGRISMSEAARQLVTLGLKA